MSIQNLLTAMAVAFGISFSTGSALAATPNASPTASATASTPARTIAVYNPADPYFLQSGFNHSFDEHMFSYKKADSMWVLVNKVRPLVPQTYRPKVVRPAFAKANLTNPLGQKLRADAATALVDLDKAMFAEIGKRIYFASGYRSYQNQKIVHAAKVRLYGAKKGENLAAREGYSEHQTGLAADILSTVRRCNIGPNTCFGKEPAGKWLAANSWRFGFILRYPPKQTKITGYQYEPWHFRYVGILLSTEYHYSGAPNFEQFLGAGSAENYGDAVTNPDYFN